MNKSSLLRLLFTAAVVIVAALLGHALWKRYLYSPWTRDGRVRADVVRIAPDVSGLVAAEKVKDKQLVHKGDVLMIIDRDRYRLALQQAEAGLAVAKARAQAARAGTGAAAAVIASRKAEYEMYRAQAQRRLRMPPHSVISTEDRQDAVAAAASARAALQQAQASRNQAGAAVQQALAAVQQAQVQVAVARLTLERTDVRAPADGYITNLDVRVGDYASVGAARMALIDSHSYYIYGYFEETKLPRLHVGDPVDIRLMAGGTHLSGTITGIAHGITDSDNPAGPDLLANVSPIFNWVRLAQRMPVRIAIDTEHLPPNTVLAAGMTATLVVKPRSELAGSNIMR
jgi:multidrug resistance efflux pump